MNLINNISSFFSDSTQKKEIKPSFMPKIKREPKTKKFNNLSSNLTKYLFDFFSYKELYEMGKTNLYFMNNIIDYIDIKNPWPEQIRKFKSKYNSNIYQGEVDLSEKEAKIKKRTYKIHSIMEKEKEKEIEKEKEKEIEKEKEVNYYQFDIDGNKYISIARTFDWAHKNNERYWKEENINGGYETNEKTPYLVDVCWLDTKFYFFHVKPNNYKLYINEHFIKSRNFKNRVVLRVIIDENIVIYKNKFPNQKIFDNNCSEKDNSILKEDFICFIKKEDFNKGKKDENDEYIIKIEFNHEDDSFWKNGWYIDGGCLMEISQKEMDNEIAIINKNKEEEEKKKVFRRFDNDK